MISTPSVFGSRCRRGRGTSARRPPGGAHVVVLLQRDDLAAHDARRGEPGGDRQRDDHRPEVDGAEDRERDDRERQVRQPVERVEEAHHPVVEPPADEARDRAVDDADDQDRERRGEADPDRDRGRRARRASRGRGRTGRCRTGARGSAAGTPVEKSTSFGSYGETIGDEDAVERRSSEEDDAGDHRAAVAHEAAPGVAPEARLRGPARHAAACAAPRRAAGVADVSQALRRAVDGHQVLTSPRPRVEDPVEDVDDQVREDDDHREQDREPHHHGVVARR